MHGIARVAACGLLMGILSACAAGSKPPPGVLPEYTAVPPPPGESEATGRAKAGARRGSPAAAPVSSGRLTVPRTLR